MLDQLDKSLEELFGKKAPALPANVKEIIVKVAPWLVIVGLVLSVPAILALLGVGAVVSTYPVYGMGQARGMLWVAGLFTIGMMVLEGLAIPGLMARKRQGWKYMWYATLVSAVGMLVSFNLIGLVVGTAISFYLLYQVKGYYSKG